MMLPANCHKSRCGFCLEVNYDHKVNHIRFLWGIRNDKVDGIINPKLINYFMVRNQGCLNICDNFKKANEDHWLVWRELKLQRGLKNNNQAISGSQIDYLAQNLTTKLQTEIEKDLQGF